MLTFDQIRRAYDQTGLLPKPRTTLKDGYACPLGAVFSLQTGQHEAGTIEVYLHFTDLPKPFKDGIMDGFDDHHIASYETFLETTLYNEGHTLGRTVRNELLYDPPTHLREGSRHVS